VAYRRRIAAGPERRGTLVPLRTPPAED